MKDISKETNDSRGCGGDFSCFRHSHRRGLGHFARMGRRARRNDVLERTRTALVACVLMVSTGLFVVNVGFATSAQALGTSAPPAVASNVIPPLANPHGTSYGQWDASWWQWLYQTPVSINPEFSPPGTPDAPTAVDCSAGQSGQVWFIGGTFVPSSTAPGIARSDVYRTCTIPTGTFLFFPLINSEADNLACPNTTLTANQLTAAAAQVINNIVPGSMSATIDGASVSGLADSTSIYRAPSPWFSYTLPADNVGPFFGCDFPAGTTPPPVDGHSGATADGVYLMSAPLKPGVHHIHFGGETNGTLDFIENVNYTITVR